MTPNEQDQLIYIMVHYLNKQKKEKGQMIVIHIQIVIQVKHLKTIVDNHVVQKVAKVEIDVIKVEMYYKNLVRYDQRVK